MVSVLIFRVEIIYTFLADGAASFWMFCHLDISVSCSVVLLFIEVDGNVVSVNFCFCLYIKYSSFNLLYCL